MNFSKLFFQSKLQSFIINYFFYLSYILFCQKKREKYLNLIHSIYFFKFLIIGTINKKPIALLKRLQMSYQLL